MFIYKPAKLLVILLISSFSLTLQASQTQADDILGYWLSESGKGVIEITRNNKNQYEGRIIWLKDIHEGKISEQLDVKNPSENLRKRSLMGVKNLSGFSFVDGKWQGGEVYDPAKGKTYKSYISMPDVNTLKLRGYVGIALFGRTSIMTRQKSAIPDKYSQ